MDLIRTLHHLNIFKNISEASLRELQNHSKVLLLNSRELLAEKGAPVQDVFVVLHGALKMQMKNPFGDFVIFHFLTRGDTIGGLFSTNPEHGYGSQFVAIEDSAVLQIPNSIFQKLIATEPSVAAYLHHEAMERLLELHHEKFLLRGHIPEKVADLFLRLLDRQGPHAGSRILIKLSLNDVARKIGAEPESVIRHISQWKKNEWVRIENKHIEVLNRPALEALTQHQRILAAVAPA
ncbi:MAG: Crp/Fnr family transcriptional regulator [Bdellovibrionia bacterium]